MAESSSKCVVRVLATVFDEFCKVTSIHGVRHLGNKRWHWFERILWAIAISVSILFCFKWLNKTWDKRNSVITTIANEATPISEIKFPAVTMCSGLFNNEFYLSDEFINNSKNLSIDHEAIQKHSAVANFCKLPDLDQYKNSTKFVFNPNILELLQKMTPNMEQFSNCYFKERQPIECSKVFGETVTDIGLCLTFKNFNLSQIYDFDALASDFPKMETNSTSFPVIEYPYRMKNSGIGLTMVLKVPIVKNTYNGQCENNFDGFKMLIHSIDVTPHMRKNFIHIPYDHDVRITIRPNIITTTKDVINNYKPNARGCITDDENQLKFFKKYSQNNCRLENYAIQAAKLCGCVFFHMPRHNQTNVCHLNSEIKCVTDVGRNENIKTSTCLPACNLISYDTEISTAKLVGTESSDYRRVVISIVFNDQQYYASIRSELYGTMDFIAAWGGILSIFMGISILNLVEVIYFATLRILFHLKNNQNILKQNENSGHKNQSSWKLTIQSIYEN